MSDRRLSLVTSVLLGLGTVSAVVAVILGLSRGEVGRGLGLAVFADDIHWFLSFVLFLPIGALISWRHPRNPVGWLVLTVGLGEVLSKFSYEYAARGLVVDPGSFPGAEAMAWLSAWIWGPELCLFPFLVLLFPTGRSLSRRWSWVGWVPVIWMCLFFVSTFMLWPYRGVGFLVESESFAVPDLASFERVVMGAFPIVLLGLAGSLISLIVRFRRARGVERQQLKWIAFTAALGFTNLVISDFVLAPLGLETRTTVLIGETLGGPGLFAIAAGVAMLRYRLYDIDVVINRALVYGSLTAVLAGVYVGLVFGMQAVLAPLTAESDLAIAASTLAVAALFRPFRSRVQSFIDHRFYRRKVDAQRTIEEFNSQLRDEVELTAVTSRLVDVVRDTMQPGHVSLWLASHGRTTT